MTSQERFHTYCCRDSAVTYEINEKLSKWVTGKAAAHYQFNMQLLNPLLYMELRGIRYDSKLASERLLTIKQSIYGLQHSLNTLSGRHLPSLDKEILRRHIRAELCYKRDPTRVKSGCQDDYNLSMLYLRDGPDNLTLPQLGFLSTVLGTELNIKSSNFKTYLYEELNLPIQYDKKDKTKDKEDRSQTTNAEALLILKSRKDNTPLQQQSLDLSFDIAELRTRAQMLQISSDGDGRVRCGYNVVGTDTGRITCYTSPTGSGYNLQTIPAENPLRPIGHPLQRGMRDLFIADPGHYLFQCDLSGADGYTVGAHLFKLGEPTMLDDLMAKIKPAQRLAYMLRHGNDSLKGKSREEIKILLREIKKEDYDYFMCKVGIWGICYLMGVDLLADVIFKESEGKVSMSRSDVESFRKSVYAAYRPERWHNAVTERLKKQSFPAKLVSASGHTRTFFGRYNEILGQALANEPQENTTYAIKLALLKLWNDPENRITHPHENSSENSSNSIRMGLDSRSVGTIRNPPKLRIEPFLTVHDSLLGQFRIEDVSWAVPKIREYFNNTLTIAGMPIIIPFSGTYGTNWAMDEASTIGEI